jgi:excisionase family DNA binding protein
MTEHAPFVSVPGFAELVGLSERTCWNLIRQRALPVYRIGRRTLVKTEEGLATLEQVAKRHPHGGRRKPVSGRPS